jgi:hypothetical protein
MNDKLIRIIQNAIKNEPITTNDYYMLYTFFQRLYIQQSIKDNIIHYMDNKPYADNALFKREP